MAAVSAARPIVIGCCSRRKVAPPSLTAALFAEEGRAFVDAWFARIEREPPVCRADALYRGRAFALARDAARRSGCDFAVLSAGLGLVGGRTPIPSYDLSAEVVLQQSKASPSDWWSRASAAGFHFGPSPALARAPVILIALTRPYARLLGPWLESLKPAEAVKLRLFGLGLARALPANVHRTILPYDETIPALATSGIKGDFAARALALHLEGRSRWCLASEIAEVAARRREIGQRAARARVSDQAIGEALAAMGGGASHAAVLDGLRARGIACGSQRLARLRAASEAIYAG